MREFDYHLDNVKNRLAILLLVLQYDSQKNKHFSMWDRVQICRERSAMQSFIDYLFLEINHSDINWYRVPNEVENKIIEISKAIELSKPQWKPEKNL